MSLNPEQLAQLIAQAQRVLTRLETVLPQAVPAPDWSAVAHRWRSAHSQGQALLAQQTPGWLEPVHAVSSITLDDLQHIERQRETVLQNTQQFLRGLPANNVLLTGARGTGKSSLVKAMLQAFHTQGLRLIEMDRSDLMHLPYLCNLIAQRPERFIVFCDDLSFEEGDATYKALKSVLDGSVAASSANVLIYATSNRRHLMPESMRDNLASRHDEDGELHPAEAIEEKISLSERFGLWVPFHPFNQQAYLTVVQHWLGVFGITADQHEAAQRPALQFALERGSRSGRVAFQFAKHWAGQTAASKHTTNR